MDRLTHEFRRQNETLTHDFRRKRRQQLVIDAKEMLDGFTTKQIIHNLAEKYGLQSQYVLRILVDDIGRSDLASKTDNIILRKAHELLSQGTKFRAKELVTHLSAQLQVSVKRVRDILKSADFRVPKEPTLNQQTLINHLNKGRDIKTIVKLMGCSKQYINHLYNSIIEHPDLHDLVPDKQQLYDNRKLQYSALRADTRRKIVESLESNPEFTIDQHAANCGCTVKQVQVIINNSLFTKANISYQEHNPRRYKYLQVIADLINTDLTITELAKKHKKQVTAIFNMVSDCRAVGIPVKERRDGRVKQHIVDH
jgi:hypothetical protein